jgi:hypothetical protein
MNKIVLKDKMTRDLDRIKKDLDQLPERAYTFWVAHTPIDTGRARKSTSLKGDTIEARYPYAKRLDDGWSNQAPDGMSKPTEAFVKKQLNSIMRKK